MDQLYLATRDVIIARYLLKMAFVYRWYMARVGILASVHWSEFVFQLKHMSSAKARLMRRVALKHVSDPAENAVHVHAASLVLAVPATDEVAKTTEGLRGPRVILGHLNPGQCQTLNLLAPHGDMPLTVVVETESNNCLSALNLNGPEPGRRKAGKPTMVRDTNEVLGLMLGERVVDTDDVLGANVEGDGVRHLKGRSV